MNILKKESTLIGKMTFKTKLLQNQPLLENILHSYMIIIKNEQIYKTFKNLLYVNRKCFQRLKRLSYNKPIILSKKKGHINSKVLKFQ